MEGCTQVFRCIAFYPTVFQPVNHMQGELLQAPFMIFCKLSIFNGFLFYVIRDIVILTKINYRLDAFVIELLVSVVM
mgnify:CR=1 FL=1